MNIIKKKVLLLKARDGDSDKYESILTANDFTVNHLQILDFKYVNMQILNSKLTKVDDYDGIIFTSPRAVYGTKSALNGAKLNGEWCNKSNFVVGDTTFDLVQKELGIVCKGKDCGNASKLADVILQEHAVKCFKRFLFPSGNLRRETLGKQLKARQIDVDDVTVYETVQSCDIKDNFMIITSNLQNVPEYVVYFSPSGVKFTTEIFDELRLNIKQLKLVAIGPSTEEALKCENLPVYAVADKPNEAELLKAILK